MLTALILAAAVANLNMEVANVALPAIGQAFDASQTALNLVAVGFSLGLAASVIYLGAVGDRYGRKMMLVLGMACSIPAALLAAVAPSVEVLLVARIAGGIAAGMAYPTTLAMITALWRGAARTRAIALWSALGGALSALGPLASGVLLESHPWRAVFLLTIPIAAVTLLLVLKLVPSHVHETSEPVDHLGGGLSILFVGALVLMINFLPVPGGGTLSLILGVVTLVTGAAFVVRQRRAAVPVYDLTLAARRPFWVAALAGIIVFGALMGAVYVGQLFLQNVLGYSALQAGAAILPAVALLVAAAPVSTRLVGRYGSRVPLLVGFGFCLAGFAAMLAFWDVGVGYWAVFTGYGLIGIGVGIAGTPASQALTNAVPVRRAGMASGTADLQRDLGGAVMQSVLGALLAAGYASSVGAALAQAPPDVRAQVSDDIRAQLQQSYAGALSIAEQAPQYRDAIVAAARESFLHGAQAAYLTGMVATGLGALIVAVAYPGRAREREMVLAYAREDRDAPA